MAGSHDGTLGSNIAGCHRREAPPATEVHHGRPHNIHTHDRSNRTPSSAPPSVPRSLPCAAGHQHSRHAGQCFDRKTGSLPESTCFLVAQQKTHDILPGPRATRRLNAHPLIPNCIAFKTNTKNVSFIQIRVDCVLNERQFWWAKGARMAPKAIGRRVRGPVNHVANHCYQYKHTKHRTSSIHTHLLVFDGAAKSLHMKRELEKNGTHFMKFR